MEKIFAELKRRNVYRVAAAYAVVAWLLLQIVNNVAPGLNLPNWVVAWTIVLLALGFPIALLFCWIQQMAGGDAGAAVKLQTTRLDYVLAGALILVIGLVSYQQLTTGVQESQTAGVTEARLAAASPATAVSIAVLPFANVSADPAQEFFADGMTDEISAALAKIPDLRVVARTSAFQFKGQNANIATISQALNATHLIEGTVRKAGERVRITVQLVQASDGLRVWSSNYDRDLTDIFGIQEEIARAVVSSLGMQLGLPAGELLISSRSSDLESYEKYLQAKSLFRARGLARLTEASALLEQVVSRDPNYAPAWALLGLVYGLTPDYQPAQNSGSVEETRALAETFLPKTEEAAERAVLLDPGSTDGHAALGYLNDARGDLVRAEEHYLRALALDPNHPDAMHSYSMLLAAAGKLKEAIPIRQRLLALEPFVPPFVWNSAVVLRVDGQLEAALELANTLSPGDSALSRANILAEMGKYREAADAFLENTRDNNTRELMQAAVEVLRTAPAPASSPAALPTLGNYSWIYFHVGAESRVLEYSEAALAAGYIRHPIYYWGARAAALRKTERFKSYLLNSGIVAYWRARGWPDLCRPVGADDFVCD